jgi:predicted transcriptional regulator
LGGYIGRGASPPFPNPPPENDRLVGMGEHPHFAESQFYRKLTQSYPHKTPKRPRLLSVLTDKETFWRDHLIEGIPEPFISEISELDNSQIIADTSVEVFRVYSYYLIILDNARQIHWISPVANPDQIQIMARRIAEGIPVEMIVNREVAFQFQGEPYASILKEVKSHPGFRISVTNRELKLGIIVTEKDLMLGLYTGDGLIFDVSCQFMSSDPRSRSWGERLYAHFMEDAVPFPE